MGELRLCQRRLADSGFGQQWADYRVAAAPLDVADRDRAALDARNGSAAAQREPVDVYRRFYRGIEGLAYNSGCCY